jgi:hypothetical protein
MDEECEKNYIIGLQQCQDELYVGVLCGSILIMNEFKANLLVIYKVD